jgi:ABC-type sugar transport system ATPase subunit
VPGAQIDRQVAEAARLLGIEPLLDRRVQQISGGEQQRVAIGRAIVQKPQLYLLDEPISNLDASLRESVRAELRRLQQELRATMVMVTHDQLDALAVADRIAVMRLGKLQQIGTPADLYARPANLFVAGFVGRLRMNFLAGRAGAEAGAPVLRGEGFALPLPPHLAQVVRPAHEMTVGIRPESLDMMDGPASGAMAARLLVEQFQGDQVVCAAQLGSIVVQSVQPARRGRDTGTPVWLRPHPAQLHLFDTASGERLPVPAGTSQQYATMEGNDP